MTTYDSPEIACINKIIENINDKEQNKVGTQRTPFLPKNEGKIPLKMDPNNGKNTNNLSILTFHTISIINSNRTS